MDRFAGREGAQGKEMRSREVVADLLNGIKVALGFLLLWLGAPGAGSATVWHVRSGAEHPTGLVEEAVANAGDGDTILVDPGIYAEHIPIGSKTISIMSVGGHAVTTLDGTQAVPGREGSIFYSDGTGPPSILLDGFTLTGGFGALYPPVGLVGGAVAFWARPRAGNVTIRNCTFRGNSLSWDGQHHPWGGAVFLEGIDSASLLGCAFEGNLAAPGLGDHVDLEDTNCLMGSCTFNIAPPAGSMGAGIYAVGSGRLEMSACQITSNDVAADLLARSLHTLCDYVDIHDSRFLDYSGCLARRISIDSNTDDSHTISIVGNVFAGREICGSESNLMIIAARGQLDARKNSIVGLHVECGPLEGSAANWQNNILFRSPLVVTASAGTISCNDAWPDTIRIRCCTIELLDNVSADPLFCEESAMNWELARESICAAENSPTGCGSIGALPVSCQRTAVRKTTWGGIRGTFR